MLERRHDDRVETFKKLIKLGLFEEYRKIIRRNGEDRRIKILDIAKLEDQRKGDRRKAQMRLSAFYEEFCNRMVDRGLFVDIRKLKRRRGQRRKKNT